MVGNLCQLMHDSSKQESEDDEARDNFKLLLKEYGEGIDKYKAAMGHDQNIAKEIKQCIDEDKTRDGSNKGSSRLAHYMKMSAKLQEDAFQTIAEDRKSKNK
jgi:hypothetical protein